MDKKNITPAKWTLFLVLGTFAIGLMTPIASDWIKLIILLSALILFIGCFISILSIANTYNNRASSINGIISLYLDTVMLFASAYFFTSVIDSGDSIVFGISQVCMQSECYLNSLVQAQSLVDAFMDSIYLSVLVMTTSGDSSIGVGEGWGRWLVIFQLFTTVYISLVGLANYFSHKSSRELADMEERVIKHLTGKVSVATQPIGQGKKTIWQRLVSFFS
ncbi:hypothetical protein [Methylophaga frappieri]|nr:hypothetical protein [Methylophaga frappieri]